MQARRIASDVEKAIFVYEAVQNEKSEVWGIVR